MARARLSILSGDGVLHPTAWTAYQSFETRRPAAYIHVVHSDPKTF